MPVKETRDFYSALRERDEILERTRPLREREEELLARIRPLEAELDQVRQTKAEIEMPRLPELMNIIAALAPMPKRIKAEPGAYGVQLESLGKKTKPTEQPEPYDSSGFWSRIFKRK